MDSTTSKMVKRSMNYITVDPGITGTGWATWNAKWKLLSNGVITAPGKYSFEEKTTHIANKLYAVRCKYSTLKLFIEYPAVFGGASGQMVAMRGDIVKLAWFVGYVCAHIDIPVFELVPVIKWKGQLPKSVVIHRIKKLLPGVNAKSHDWDAIGIGLYKKGVF